MTRKEILETAEKIVNSEREKHYGTPENNFRTIVRQDLNDEPTEVASTSATTAAQAARDTEAEQYIKDMITRWLNSWKGR